MKTELVPDKATLSSRKGPSTEQKGGKGPGQRIMHFQGSCEELRGWVSTVQTPKEQISLIWHRLGLANCEEIS
eukprot:3316728-Ditylum_brightwellii.AAC.1